MTREDGIQKVLDHAKETHPELGDPSEGDRELVGAMFDAACSWYSEEIRTEVERPWRDFVEHILATDTLTPGGSNEGWAKRLLNGET